MTALYLDAPDDAALDVAVSHALLEAGTRGHAAMRVWTPPPAVSFGRLDLLSPRSNAAVAAARELGLEPVRRLAGGRAAAIGPGTVCLGLAQPSPDMTGMQERYEWMAGIVVAALARAGVTAEVGELPGEWCPGSWSVIAAGAKVSGLAQRWIRGGAWTEAVIVVADADGLTRRLDRVQQALGVAWDPSTLTGLAGVTPEKLRRGLIDLLAGEGAVPAAALPPEIRRRAAALRAEHAL